MSTGQTATAPQASIARYKAALRKAKRRNAREPEIDFLNITAMLDLMTIILVFLLKSLASSTGAIPQSDDLRLPASVMTGEPADEGVPITVAKSQILVGEPAISVVKLPPRDQLAATGVDVKFKRGGPTDMYIVPLGNALQHARDIDKAVRAAKGLNPNTSEAIVIVDKSTPYRLLIEVLFTLGQSEFGEYHLMVMSGKK
ncbi:MAG TPA: biopolymer transporter ExbD [Polyangium sp.]|nr:biopolymer transporter ExbD [Polyangium sp.]